MNEYDAHIMGSLGRDLASIDLDLTDLSNARRLILTHGGDIKYCPAWRSWLIWDGKRWRRDQDGVAIEQKAKDVVYRMRAEAELCDDPELRKVYMRHVARSESNARIKAMIDLARSEEGTPISPDELDRSPWLLNVNNGIVDLRTGSLIEHDKSHLITKLAPVDYDAEASCPKWLEFLDKIMAGNSQLVDYLQLAVGYTLTGDTSEDCWHILYGGGRNGKTTFIQCLHNLLGDYAWRTPSDTFLIRGQQIPNDVAQLKGKRFVYASEIREGQHLNESLIKDLVGGDMISARFLHAEWFNFKSTCKLWLSTNHKPVIKGTDEGMWSRVRLVPFTVRIPEEEIRPRDEVLAEFAAEAPGILNWAIEGCMAWQAEGLPAPEGIRAATETYREEMDTLGEFLGECCLIGQEYSCQATHLYRAYSDWCRRAGEHVMSQTAFGRRLTERGFKREKVGRAIYRLGIGLEDNMDVLPGLDRRQLDS